MVVNSSSEELERHVLGVEVLHVHVDEGAPLPGQPEDRPQTLLGRRQPCLPRQRLVVRGQRRGLHTDVDAVQRPEVVALQVVVGGPVAAGVVERHDQLLDAGCVAIGLGADHGLLAQHVDGVRAAPPPQLVQPGDRVAGGVPDDELPGHPHNVAAGDPGLHAGTEGHPVCEVDAQVQGLGGVDAVEVLGQVAGDIGRVGQRREDVDEAEQLRLEPRPLHRPVHDAIAPPGAAEDAGAPRRGQVGDPTGQRDRVALDLGDHGVKVAGRWHIPAAPVAGGARPLRAMIRKSAIRRPYGVASSLQYRASSRRGHRYR
jgi:hypothetical protein